MPGSAARIGSNAADAAGAHVHVAQARGRARRTGPSPRLATQRLDHHRAVERLVGDLADLGAQPLRPRHQRRGRAAGRPGWRRSRRGTPGSRRAPSPGPRPASARRRSPSSPACRPPSATARSVPRPPRRRSSRWTGGHARWGGAGATPSAVTRYCRVTARRVLACMRYCMTPAPRRRATMPTARRAATAMKSPAPPTAARCRCGRPRRRAARRGRWTSRAPRRRPRSARRIRLPSVGRVKISGSRRIATASTPKPARVVDPCRPPDRPSRRQPLPCVLRPGRARRREPRRGQGIPGRGRAVIRRPHPRRMTLSLARRERLGLCDLALALGENAPTLCQGWVAKDLIGHLVIQEHRPLAGVGIAVPFSPGSPSGR